MNLIWPKGATMSDSVNNYPVDTELHKLIAREKWGVELTDDYVRDLVTFIEQMHDHWNVQNAVNRDVWRILYRTAQDPTANVVKSDDELESLNDFIRRFPRPLWMDE
jgi:hypothetical protein